MLDDLARDIGLAEIARELNITPQHFCRAFKAAVGQPPQAWHAERRLQRARELLLATELSVSDIAGEVGYSSAGAFATAFGRRTGMPPAAWRAANRP
jgi:AraC family transcriptional regulator